MRRRLVVLAGILCALAMFRSSQAQTTYVGNSLTQQGFEGADSQPPLVILGEYSPANPLAAASPRTTLYTGPVQDVKFYGQNYNFTLYALSLVSNGPNPKEQTFKVVALQSFSGSAGSAGIQTLPVSGFSVKAGDLLAFAGTGPYYPQTSNDATNSDATYEDSSNPNSYTATPPGGSGTVFVVGIHPDTNANYEYIPDAHSNQGRTYAIGVDVLTNCPSIQLAPGSLPTGTAGSGYSQTISASGGDGPDTFAVTGGSLPAGLTLASGGLLSGTPRTPGVSSFTVTATATNGCSGSTNYSLTVNCPLITLAPATLPAGTAGSSYNQTITASGGGAPYTFSVTGGTLPSGLSLSSGGSLSGTPHSAGTACFMVQARDTNNCTGTISYCMTNTCPTITLNPGTLPAANKGVSYSQQITASGGSAPYTFALTSGSVPTGMSLSSSGLLSGTPTGETMPYNFTITATDTNGCMGSTNYTLTLQCPLINASALPDGTIYVSYNATITAGGGTAPYTFAVTSGSPPSGLTLSSSGTLSGTPNSLGASGLFGVQITDAHGCSVTAFYNITISCPTITLSPGTLPACTDGSSYNQTITASGGNGVINFAVTSGSLPNGLSLSSGGSLAGTPAAPPGTYSFTVTGTEANDGCTGSLSYNLTVNCPTIGISPSTLPSGTQGVPYSQQITTSGDSAPCAFTLTSGSLPTGLSLSTSGLLSGTPATAAAACFTVTATDTNGCMGRMSYCLSNSVCGGPTVYRGNGLAVPQLQPGETFARDTVPPLVILGEYNPTGPLGGAGLELPSGTVQDVKWYGTNANFTLYALAYIGPGSNANEQVFQVVSSETFSNSIYYPPGTNTLPATNFFVNCGNLLAFSGIGPFYPNFTPEDQPNYDATYGNATNNSSYPLAFQATPPGPGQIFSVGMAGDTDATYDYIPNTYQNQGRYYAIGVDISLCGVCTSNCLSLTCPGGITNYTCNASAQVFYTAEVSDICSTNPPTVTYSPPSGWWFSVGTTTPVTVTASDSLGNTQSCTFSVTVLPGNCPTNSCITLNCSNVVAYTCGGCTPVAYGVTASDPCCSNILALTFDPPAGACFPVGTSEVMVTATDACGNMTTSNFTVTVMQTPACEPGATWTKTSLPATNWISIASSADGTYLVAAAFYGGIYTSANSGATWTQTSAPFGYWQAVASSADGTHLVAAIGPGQVGGGGIYTSANGGQTWSQTSAPSEDWQAVASSADGSHLVAVNEFGGIYTSANGGQIWAQTSAPSEDWQAVASSSNGTYLVAVVADGGIYTSANSGATWTEQTSGLPGPTSWDSVASSADGSHLVATVDGGGIYTSGNGGATWTQTSAPSEFWWAVASSADGTHLVAVANQGGIYTSANSGVTWTEQTGGLPSSAYWESVASSSDGSLLIAGGNNINGVGGGIYISACTPCLANCLSIQCSNVTVYTCDSCATAPFNATATDTCCSNGVVLSYSVPTNNCFAVDTLQLVQVTAEDDCGNTATNSYWLTVLRGDCSNNACLTITWSNSVLYTCSGCAKVASLPVVTDNCCGTNFSYIVQGWPYLYGLQNDCIPVNHPTYVVVLAHDECGNYASKEFSIEVLPGNCPTNNCTNSFNFMNFSSNSLAGSGLQLSGSAAVPVIGVEGTPVLRLTPASTFQAGSAFMPVQLGANLSFSTAFSFQMTNGGGISDGTANPIGADGIVFVLAESPGLGGLGYGAGYSGIPNSIGVKFDTWQDGGAGGYFPTANDPNGNFVAVYTDGSVNTAGYVPYSPSNPGTQPQYYTPSTSMKNGDIWFVWIDYNGNTSELDVRLSDGVNTRPATPQLSKFISLNNLSILGPNPQLYAGFTSGTGGAYDDNDILNWQLSSPCTNACISVLCSNITVTTCSNCASVPMTAIVTDLCCSNANYISTFNIGGEVGYVDSGVSVCFPVNTTNAIEVQAYDTCSTNIVSSYYTITVLPGNCQTNACNNPCIQFFGVSNLVANTCGSCVPVYYNVSADDLCCSNAQVTLTFFPTNGSCWGIGTIGQVQVTATSSCGNCNTTNFTVTVLPANCQSNCLSIQYPASIIVTTCGNEAQVFYPTPSFTDSCCSTGSIQYEFIRPSGSIFPLGTSGPMALTAHDSCGNYTTAYFTVTVDRNSTPPVLNCPSNIVVGTACSCVQVYYEPTASSASCSNVTVTCYPPSGSYFCLGTNTVTVLATDCCGNTNFCSFTVTVNQTNNCVAGITWTLQNSGSQSWTSVASDATGQHLAAAAYGGQIYTSTNYGVTWMAQNSGSEPWLSLASSADGSKLVAAGNSIGIYTSTDFGKTWALQQNSPGWSLPGGNFVAVASSADGSKLVEVIGNHTYIYTSTDSGVTWTSHSNPYEGIGYQSVASSADGNYLVASGNGGLYTSSNAGTNWTHSGPVITTGYLASSADGSHLAVAVNGGFGGQIYTSTNYGSDWTPQNSGHTNWSCIASSADGSKLIAAVQYGPIYTSTDYGVTWTAQNSGSQNWQSVASSADGTKLVAVTPGQPVYISDCTPVECCVPPPTNLVLWLPFDETYGSTSANLASPAYPGTQFNQPVPLLGSYVANSLQFNGTNYVVVPDYPGIEINSNGLTIDAWIYDTGDALLTPNRLSGIVTNSVLLDKLGSSSSGYSLWITPSNYLGNYPFGNLRFNLAGYRFVDTYSMQTLQWHFIAVSMDQFADPPQGYFYVDGALTSTFTPPPVSLFNTNSLWLAAAPPGSSMGITITNLAGPYAGALDEVEVFNRALSTNELYAIYSAGTAGKCKPCCYLNKLTIGWATPNSVQVNWGGCGTLLESTNLFGPWNPIQNAASPYVIPATGNDMFYRLECQ